MFRVDIHVCTRAQLHTQGVQSSAESEVEETYIIGHVHEVNQITFLMQAIEVDRILI